MVEDNAPAVRLSDQDRERAVARLNAAVADGQLTWAEHAERVELVLGSRTHADLEPHLADLGPGNVVVPVGRSLEVSARLSKLVRRADPGRPMVAYSWFGAVWLNLTQVKPGTETRVDATSFGGKVVIGVPEDATVIDEGHAVLGTRYCVGMASPAPGGPVVRITGRSTLGYLRVVGYPPNCAFSDRDRFPGNSLIPPRNG